MACWRTGAPQAPAARRRHRTLRSSRPHGAGEPGRRVRGEHCRSGNGLCPVRLAQKREARAAKEPHMNAGAEKPGLVDQRVDGALSGVIPDIASENLAPTRGSLLSELNRSEDGVVRRAQAHRHFAPGETYNEPSNRWSISRRSKPKSMGLGSNPAAPSWSPSFSSRRPHKL